MSPGDAVNRGGLAIVLLAATASADPKLTIERQPPRLKMRSQVAAATPATAEPAATPATAFSRWPTSKRDFEERVIVRIRAGVELDRAPASGSPLRGGSSLPNGFSDSRPWILGDAVIGARDVLLPSLGAYLLSSFQLDASDTLATRSALVVPEDANDQHIAIKAGYAEWGRDERRPQKLWLRAGRQFRLDGGAMFGYFDGATIGYRERAWNSSAFVGQRVALYVDTPQGVIYGATAAIDLDKVRGWPLRIALDYLGLVVDSDDQSQRRGMFAVTAASEPSRRLKLDARARIIENGEASLALGRIGGRARYAVSDRVLIIGDIEQRFGGDLAYDLAAPAAVDVVDVARKLGVGLAAPIDALTVGASVDVRVAVGELLVFARAEVPQGTVTAVDHQGWVEGGGAVAGKPFGPAWLTAQYTLRQYQLDADANVMGTAFDDRAGSGIDRLHEVALDAMLRSSPRASRRWRAGIGAFYRLYDLRTPYITVEHDGRVGGRADVQLWITRDAHVEVAGEVAQASPILARELGTVSAVRAAVEARW
ncbi:MAG: hypothetical protein AB7O24_17305 [Kofleriaceae bacterium]